jgi:hypothetical protein
MADRVIPEPERERRRLVALAQPGAKEGVNGKVKFQCPGCRAAGHDLHEDNAVYWPDGTFGCAYAADTSAGRGHWNAIATVLGVRLSADGAGPRAASTEPQRPKSLFALYISLAIACRRSAVAKKFLVHAFPKILYVAREDGGACIQDRRDDILSPWTERPEPGAIMFVIRPTLDLGNREHVDWLGDTCLKLGATMLWLDTWTALSPLADPLGPKDQAALAATVVKLCEDISGLVVVVDHSRKNRPEGQPLSSADIFGPPQKWAAAEHIVMLDVVDAGGRLEVFIEGKDLETRRFFLTVTPRGSGEEKFAYAGSVDELADGQRQVGDRNRQAVLATLQANPTGLSTGELAAALTAAGTPLSQDTILRHGKALVQAGAVEKRGAGPATRFVAIPAASPPPPSAENEGQTT